CPPLTPRIPAAAGHPEHAAHCFDAELSLMFFNKDLREFCNILNLHAFVGRIRRSRRIRHEQRALHQQSETQLNSPIIAAHSTAATAVCGVWLSTAP
ncbi:hypothetical protein, partial [Aromatoleum toluclasticum]|uniref:hypothetical protein n=1 Tax=Aromatoleum toluclasticum TaxID=92003 RepID=UPI003F68BEFA